MPCRVALWRARCTSDWMPVVRSAPLWVRVHVRLVQCRPERRGRKPRLAEGGATAGISRGTSAALLAVRLILVLRLLPCRRPG